MEVKRIHCQFSWKNQVHSIKFILEIIIWLGKGSRYSKEKITMNYFLEKLSHTTKHKDTKITSYQMISYKMN